MNDWPTHRLGELVKTSITYGVVKPGESDPNGVALVRGTDLRDGRVLETQLRTITQALSATYKRTLLQGGEVLISLVGNPGQVAVAPASLKGSNIARQVGLIRPVDELDAKYLVAYLQSPEGVSKLRALTYGSVQQVINLGHLKGLQVPVPPLDEQRRIAGVLEAMEDLIEVNRTLLADLRDLVRSTCRAALVGAPDVVAADVIDLKYGRALPAKERVPGRFPVVSSAGIVDSHHTSLVTGPGVVVGRKGTVGSVTWVGDDFYPIDTAFYVKSSLPMLYVYLVLESLGLSAMNTDSAVPGLNRENALRRTVPLLAESDLARLMSVIQPLWDAAQALEAEIRELAATRDGLLPLLISGRVRVGDVAA